MTTDVIITGTGTPLVNPDRAGAGVLIRTGDMALQFDAGRSTLPRICGAGSHVSDLTAVFLTHYHSDHLVGLQDVVLSHWTHDFEGNFGTIDIVAPNGATVRYLERMLTIWDDDLEVRSLHGANRSPEPKVNVVGFDVPDTPTNVWSRSGVTVVAGQVRHEPVVGAVGYRVETPDGVIAITGDTIVCDEVAELSRGADIVIYEAMRMDVVNNEYPPSMRYIAEYHADTRLIGEQMEALHIPKLMLTHLIPQPNTPEESQAFADEVREGGYTGEIMVCDDLDTVTLEGGT